ncbi:MAG TPA: nucleotide exchange factor GrpE [Patescibacteria group bacterium]|nr:nucleotide exchange factor GrpE [Patescibacteria group bacterium]
MVKKKNENNEVQKDEPARNASASVADGSKQQIENLENQLKRTLADYQNLEKRVAEEKSGWIRMANKDLILRLLPTLGHLETVLKGAKDSGVQSSWLEGVKMTVEEFRKVLAEEGLEPVQTETFDPNLHEVVQVKEGPEGKILDVLEMGYKLNGILIRPAKVIVGKETN